MPLSPEALEAAIARYVRERDRYSKLTEYVAGVCRELVRENSLRATVQWRTKDPDSLRNKLRAHEAASVEEVFQSVHDLAAVRIATYVEEDRAKVVELLRTRFDGPREDSSVEILHKDRDREPVDERGYQSYYRAVHCRVLLAEDDLVGSNENLEGTVCEVQVCSMLAHVWNEVEHDLMYKELNGELATDERLFLDMLGNLTKLGDDALKALINATEARLAQTTGAFENAWDFVARLKDRFPRAQNFGANALQLYEEVIAGGLASPQDIEDRLLGEGYEERADELVTQFNQYLERTGDTVLRQIDGASSDVLLVLFLEDHADGVIGRNPAGRGRGRPKRIASAASRFRQFRAEAALQT